MPGAVSEGYGQGMSDPTITPFERLGGREAVLALAERFYDAMEANEPALAALHPQDPPGRIARASRDRFAMFLVGWLGGPQDYIATHGHPRLRMRHGHVPIDEQARDAWLRCMATALDGVEMEPDLRRWLDNRFREVGDFLRNREAAGG
jgi:hemoglobin